MCAAHDEVLNLRIPTALRADLDGAARANGLKLSVVARNALAVGLASLRSSIDDRDPPPPAAPAALMSAAA